MSPISADLMFAVAMKSGLVVASTLALLAALRGLPASQRALIAHLGLVVAVAMPPLVLAGPELEVAGIWTRETLTIAAPHTAEPIQALAATPPVTAGLPPMERPAPPIDVIVFLAWAAGSLVLAAGLSLGLVRLFRLQRQAIAMTDGEWLGALAQARRRLGVKQRPALLRSDRLASPISWGLFRPTIMLSAGALQTPERAKAILAHELAHVARLDWLNLLVARVATALFWFNPLVWILARQAHELREEAADDVVLRGDVDAPSYADMLVQFARGERDMALAAHGVAPARGSLKRRLTRVLDGGARREPARPMWVFLGLAGAAALALPLAAFTPLASRPPVVLETAGPTAPVPSAPTAPAADRSEFELSAAQEAAIELAVEAELAETDAGPLSQDPPPATKEPARVARLSPEALASMSLHGVTPEWIAALEQELPWVRSLSAGQLTTLAIHDVTPEWVKGMRGVGYDRLTFDQATSMAVHGIGPAYVRDMAQAGLTGLSVDQLIGLKIAGVDARHVRRMEAEGVTDVEDLRRSALIGPRPGRRSPPAIPRPPQPTPGPHAAPQRT